MFGRRRPRIRFRARSVSAEARMAWGWRPSFGGGVGRLGDGGCRVPRDRSEPAACFARPSTAMSPAAGCPSPRVGRALGAAGARRAALRARSGTAWIGVAVTTSRPKPSRHDQPQVGQPDPDGGHDRERSRASRPSHRPHASPRAGHSGWAARGRATRSRRRRPAGSRCRSPADRSRTPSSGGEHTQGGPEQEAAGPRRPGRPRGPGHDRRSRRPSASPSIENQVTAATTIVRVNSSSPIPSRRCVASRSRALRPTARASPPRIAARKSQVRASVRPMARTTRRPGPVAARRRLGSGARNRARGGGSRCARAGLGAASGLGGGPRLVGSGRALAAAPLGACVGHSTCGRAQATWWPCREATGGGASPARPRYAVVRVARVRRGSGGAPRGRGQASTTTGTIIGAATVRRADPTPHLTTHDLLEGVHVVPP